MATIMASKHKTIGKLFSNEIGYIELEYDFANDAGAFADAINLGTFTNKTIIHSCIPYVQTACTSGGSATVDCGIAGGDVDCFLDATAVATLVDDYTAQESGNIPMVVAAADHVLLDIGVADLTAGKIIFKITYSNAV